MSGEKNGCLAWPGLDQAGLSGENKMVPPKAGTRFFSPLRDIFSFPGEKNGIIWDGTAKVSGSAWTHMGPHLTPMRNPITKSETHTIQPILNE